jgi:hypothetical protein
MSFPGEANDGNAMGAVGSNRGIPDGNTVAVFDCRLRSKSAER